MNTRDRASASDEDLMHLYQKEDASAFDLLFARYSARADNFIYRMIGSASRAEEIGQEAFLRIIRRADSYRISRSPVRSSRRTNAPSG